MFGKLIGAIVGEKVAGKNEGLKGAVIGAAIPAIARRGLGPLSLVLGAGWLAKKVYQRRKAGKPIAPEVKA